MTQAITSGNRRYALSLATIAMLACAPGAAAANGIGFSLGLGAQVTPDYFGADTYEVRPWGFGALHELEIGAISRADPGPREDREGLSFGGAFRASQARLSEDNPELSGLEDVPWSLEAGARVAYSTGTVRGHAELRYGVIGHGTLVGELGGDYIFRPGFDTTITLGPRLQIGSADYAQTYFGVSADEAAASAFSEFEAEGGLLAAGLQLNVVHRLNDDWSVRGRVDLRQLQGSAADSPITRNGSAFQATAGVTLVRRFTLDF